MQSRTVIAAALLLVASLTACGSRSDGKSAAASPSVTTTTAPAATETGISKACSDDVFDMFIDEMKGKGIPEHRPDSCAHLTDEQWSQAVNEASEKALAAGGAAIGSGADTTGDQPTEVVFKVWGSAPSGVDINYGSDSESLDGSGLPMTKELKYDPEALYYTINAQLEGGGDIRCSVTVGDQTEDAHARGDYNICSAQINTF